MPFSDAPGIRSRHAFDELNPARRSTDRLPRPKHRDGRPEEQGEPEQTDQPLDAARKPRRSKPFDLDVQSLCRIHLRPFHACPAEQGVVPHRHLTAGSPSALLLPDPGRSRSPFPPNPPCPPRDTPGMSPSSKGASIPSRPRKPTSRAVACPWGRSQACMSRSRPSTSRHSRPRRHRLRHERDPP